MKSVYFDLGLLRLSCSKSSSFVLKYDIGYNDTGNAVCRLFLYAIAGYCISVNLSVGMIVVKTAVAITVNLGI